MAILTDKVVTNEQCETVTDKGNNNNVLISGVVFFGYTVTALKMFLNIVEDSRSVTM